jgi:hypothetical protein
MCVQLGTTTSALPPGMEVAFYASMLFQNGYRLEDHADHLDRMFEAQALPQWSSLDFSNNLHHFETARGGPRGSAASSGDGTVAGLSVQKKGAKNAGATSGAGADASTQGTDSTKKASASSKKKCPKCGKKGHRARQCELWIEDDEEWRAQQDQKQAQPKKAAHAVTVRRVSFADDRNAIPHTALSTVLAPARGTDGDVSMSVGTAAPVVATLDVGDTQPQGLVEATAVESPAPVFPSPPAATSSRVDGLPVLSFSDLKAGRGGRTDGDSARTARAEPSLQDFQRRE